ncbi:PDC sensor domain-containing protein [Candidatus Dependentiae bacterium]|nr:PDC sensor domain-containing protein [Candidatus Dependentiae bacterium]
MKSNFTLINFSLILFLLLFVSNCVSNQNSQNQNKEEQAPVVTDADAQLKINTEKKLTELANTLKDKKLEPKEMYGILKNFIEQNPDILASAFAFAPTEKDGKIIKTSPYIYRNEGKILEKDLIDFYDYTSPNQKWYTETVKSGAPMWSEPYYDDGGAGADILMTTYSIPLYSSDTDKLFIGVLTADLLISKKNKQ